MMEIDSATRTASGAFLKRIADSFPVTGAMLFGSRARGDHQAESDADVAVLPGGELASFVDVKLAMADVVFDVLLETGVLTQPLPVGNRNGGAQRSMKRCALR